MQPKHLIRYALPGGYGLLMAVVLEAVYGWAWHKHVEEVISTARADPLATIGGAVIVGYVVCELIYHQLSRPCVHLGMTAKLPAWAPAGLRRRFGERTLTLCTVYGEDLGGKVFACLLSIPTMRRALEHAHGIDVADLSKQAPARCASRGERDAYARELGDRLCALHSLLRLAAATGEPDIQRNYAGQTDIYHAIGVSRVVLIAMSAVAAIDVAAKHRHAFVTHLGPSIGVTVVLLLMMWMTWRLMNANRRHRCEVMVRELVHDLRSWALRHPRQLETLAAADRDDYLISLDRGLPVEAEPTAVASRC